MVSLKSFKLALKLVNMSALSPQTLLSSVSRQRCVSKLKELSSLVLGDEEDVQNASVLVPLCIHNGEVCLLYTLRSSNLKSHSGQVSFPGGMLDPNESFVDAALRETEEEISVPREQVDVWGVMPQIQGKNKNVRITPVVGEIKNFDLSKLKENPDEVEEVFLVPMKAFCDTNNHAHWEYGGIPLPVFLFGKHRIWGITGGVTHMFLSCFLPDNEFKEEFTKKKFTWEELMPAKL